MFSPPLNAWHQHTNTGNQPAKYVAVTDAPLIFNIYHNDKFVFNTNFTFEDRYNAEADYFSKVGKREAPGKRPVWTGAYMRDVREPYPPTIAEFGEGFGTLPFQLSGNSMAGHLGRIDLGVYKKPHRHHAGAHLIIVQGAGYALMWKEWGDRVKVGFRKGSIYSPPEGWWHTHCGTGTQLIKQIALRCSIPGIGKIYKQRVGIKQGGDMLDREDEDPRIKQLFEEELKKKRLK